jgi:hypothetical protein
LRAVWQVADSANNAGAPFFRTIRTVNRRLIAGRRMRLLSQDLPTEISGSYRVRFVIQDPDYEDAAPILVYVVKPDAPRSAGEAIGSMAVFGPRFSVARNAPMGFRWSGVPLAIAYRLEFYEIGSDVAVAAPSEYGDEHPLATTAQPQLGAYDLRDRPVAGAYAPSSQLSLVTSLATQARLSKNTRYRWRVVALGNRGQIIATSRFNVLLVN